MESASGLRRLGRYNLLKKIATGGMGEVHLARLDSVEGVERLFAIKLMLPQFAKEQSAVSMFVTEARIAARINHSNVCQVFELGQEKGELFICMEYLRGILATSIVEAHNPASPLDPRLAVAIVKQAAAGLQFAHDLKDENGESVGVVHRDISPSNLFITSDGITKVLDFGIVKAKDSSIKTETGALKGNSGYMSLEQVREEPLDSRSDIFSLGVVLFELLSNRRLFARESQFATLQAIAELPIRSLASVCPNLPPELEDVLSRALAQNLESRFATMREFSEGLSNAMRPLGGLADPGEVADYIQTKFVSQLSEVDQMLRDVRQASTLVKPILVESQSAAENSKPAIVDQPLLSLSYTQLVDEGSVAGSEGVGSFGPADPFAPVTEPEQPLEILDGFDLETRRGAATQDADSIAKNRALSGTDGTTSYTDRLAVEEKSLWNWPRARVPVLVLLTWFTVSHLLHSPDWVFIDAVNLLLEKASHYLFSWGSETFHVLGKTLGQLVVPFGMGLYFGFTKNYRFAAVGCTWWFGESLIKIAGDMHDAPMQELLVIGGDIDDWVYLFSKWDMMGQAQEVADKVRWAAIIIMVATLTYLLYLIVRPSIGDDPGHKTTY